MNKLLRRCSYVVRYDVGLAPNPFWDDCTLAVCTPNHMGIRAQGGDWFMGTQPGHKGGKLIYVLEVAEVLSFDNYYRDPRFEPKKPIKQGNAKQSHGDNMYHQDENGLWQQHPTYHHKSPEQIVQDTKHPFVFIASHFYYFGENAVEIPFAYQSLVRKRLGCKCSHPPETVSGFLHWLAEHHQPGVQDEPGDWLKGNSIPVQVS